MTQLNLVILGEQIKFLRKKNRLTQAQLAEMVEVDDSLICKIEKGQTATSLGTLQGIANALHVGITALLENNQQKAVGE